MTGVLIAGAGPTGLVLACDLLRRGVDCRIIDRSPGPQPGSRGFGVKPRTLAVLADPGGRVRRRFGVPRGGVVLVRPDGYVGLVAGPEDAAAVADYLDRAGAGAPAYA